MGRLPLRFVCALLVKGDDLYLFFGGWVTSVFNLLFGWWWFVDLVGVSGKMGGGASSTLVSSIDFGLFVWLYYFFSPSSLFFSSGCWLFSVLSSIFDVVVACIFVSSVTVAGVWFLLLLSQLLMSVRTPVFFLSKSLGGVDLRFRWNFPRDISLNWMVEVWVSLVLYVDLGLVRWSMRTLLNSFVYSIAEDASVSRLFWKIVHSIFWKASLRSTLPVSIT